MTLITWYILSYIIQERILFSSCLKLPKEETTYNTLFFPACCFLSLFHFYLQDTFYNNIWSNIKIYNTYILHVILFYLDPKFMLV